VDGVEVIRRYHEQTSHWPGARPRDHVVSGFRPMAPDNQPSPFKRYRGLDREPLPTELRPPRDAPVALDVLAGRHQSTRPAAADRVVLARLLYFSAGVTRFSSRGRGRAWFRASASAGNLHPLELYVAWGPQLGLDEGLYHFDPESFSLARLRTTDVRPHLAHAVGDAALAAAPAVIVVTGLPWRTTWKYSERGWRHVFWDAGSLLANLLAVADAQGVSTRVALGFVDRQVSHIVGIDGVAEFPVAAVAVGPAAADTAPTTDPSDLDEIRPDVEPLSRDPVEFPLVTAAQLASDLDSSETVARWRAAGADDGGRTGTATARDGAENVEPYDVAENGEPVETLILRRGSTRLMERVILPGAALEWVLRSATRSAPVDAIAPGGSLLSYLLTIHAVEGHEVGLYRWSGSTLELRTSGEEASTRELSASLCLGQPLGGDSAYTVFECADLSEVLDVLGPRGYRAAHVEAGLVNGRLLLCAHALGHGATGLTFFDEAVRAAFETPASCLLVTAIGAPAYRPTPGGWPGEPVELARYDALMTRLETGLHRRPVTGR
jgi:SagB-type dehydrogenase family enzyme